MVCLIAIKNFWLVEDHYRTPQGDGDLLYEQLIACTVVPLYNAVFGMKNLASKNRVVQGDRVIEGVL